MSAAALGYAIVVALIALVAGFAVGLSTATTRNRATVEAAESRRREAEELLTATRREMEWRQSDFTRQLARYETIIASLTQRERERD